MLIIVGGIIVFASTLGGFMLAGGHPGVLLQLWSVQDLHMQRIARTDQESFVGGSEGAGANQRKQRNAQ